MPVTDSRQPSQRQLRVGEEIRHALADIFLRNETHEPEIEALGPITVSEVRITPDLKHANAYVTPLGGGDATALIKTLNAHVNSLRRSVAGRVNLRYSPSLRFRADTSFDEALKIERLLKKPEVARDIAAPAAESE